MLPKDQECQLGATVMEAVRLRDRMRQDGATAAECDAGIERTLRAAWPKGREESWKYRCQSCDDYGYEFRACPGNNSCGRERPHGAHLYAVPCWCPKGQAFKPKERTAEDAVAVAAKVKQPSRWGR